MENKNYEVTDQATKDDRPRGLEKIFENCKSHQDAVDQQLSSAWMETNDDAKAKGTDLWLVKNIHHPRLVIECKTEDEALEIKRRHGSGSYLRHVMETSDQAEQRLAEEREQRTYEFTSPTRPAVVIRRKKED